MVTQNKQTKNLPAGFKPVPNTEGIFETTQAVTFDTFTLGPNKTIILKHNLTVNEGQTFTNNGTVIIEPRNKIINNGNYINNGTTDTIEPRATDNPFESIFRDFNSEGLLHSSPNINSFSLGKTNEYIDDLNTILGEINVSAIGNAFITPNKKNKDILIQEMTLEKAALENLIAQINNNDNNKSNDTILSQTSVKNKNYNNNSDKNTVIGNNTLKNYNENDNYNIVVGDNNLNTTNQKKSNVIFGVNNIPNLDQYILENTIFGFNNNAKQGNTIFSNNIDLSSFNNKAVIGYGATNLINKFNNNKRELLINSNLLPAKNKQVNLGSKDNNFDEISVAKLNNNLTLGNFNGTNKIITLNSKGVINFEDYSRSLNLRETRNTINDKAWFPNNNGKTDLGKFTSSDKKQFKDLYLSQGIKIKNKNVIEYPFEGGKSVGVVLNGLVINSNNKEPKKLSNGNITSNDIINSGGRLSIPANKTLKFTQSAASMISNLKLDEDGDYIENIFISGPGIDILNDNKTINSNKVTAAAKYKKQYVFTYHNILNTSEDKKPSEKITNDSSVNMIIRRLAANKIEVAFRNTNQSSGY